jgi:SAM-dependent methyltransferase
MPVRGNKSAWEDWGTVDPLWAILTDPNRRDGKWDLNEFFASGQELIDTAVRDGETLGLPATKKCALDFGCGVGRLTRALTKHFEQAVGLDIAQSMVSEAKRLNADVEGCTFLVNPDDDLRTFDDKNFDFIVTVLVLQHIPSLPLIERFLGEFVRVLAPGGLLIFQLPTYIPPPLTSSLRAKIRPRSRLGVSLRRLGVSPRWLYRWVHWTPAMPMMAIPYERVIDVLEAAGGRVLQSFELGADHGGIESRSYYVTR